MPKRRKPNANFGKYQFGSTGRKRIYAHKVRLTAKQRGFVEEVMEKVTDGEPFLAAAESSVGKFFGPNKDFRDVLANKRVGSSFGYQRRRSLSNMVKIVKEEHMTKTERRSILARVARKEKARDGDVLKAVELDGKIEGDFVDKKHIQHSVNIKRISDMSDEELMEIVASGDPELAKESESFRLSARNDKENKDNLENTSDDEVFEVHYD